MDDIFRLFMFVLPYGFSVAAYIWVGMKAWRLPNKAPKVIAFAILAGGFGYTVYKMVYAIGRLFTSDNFEFAILIVNVFVLFFASIAIALGEPEKREEEIKADKT